MKTIVILLASGTSSRMNSALKKQFIPINGHPLFIYPLATFNSHPNVTNILIVGDFDEFSPYTQELSHYNKIMGIISGGSTRQESVLAALTYLSNCHFDEEIIVLIHDVARPLVTSSIISKSLEGLKSNRAVITASPATSTYAYTNLTNHLISTLNRDKLVELQTPQSFYFNDIYQAHLYAKANNLLFTDDSGIYMSLFQLTPPLIIEGDPLNYKITYSSDIRADDFKKDFHYE